MDCRALLGVFIIIVEGALGTTRHDSARDGTLTVRMVANRKQFGCSRKTSFTLHPRRLGP